MFCTRTQCSAFGEVLTCNPSIFVLFGLILYILVNNFSVMSGQDFLGLTSTKQRIKCLAQGHNECLW